MSRCIVDVVVAMTEKRDVVKIHVNIDRDIYDELWEITKREYVVPVKKFHIVVNKILRLGLQKYYETEGRRE